MCMQMCALHWEICEYVNVFNAVVSSFVKKKQTVCSLLYSHVFFVLNAKKKNNLMTEGISVGIAA